MASKTEENPDEFVQINGKVRRRQRDLLNAKAKAANLNVSKFLQKIIVDSTVVAKSDLSADLQKTCAWLSRINSNINMLSKWANTYKQDAFSDLILMRLAEIQKETAEVMQFTADLRAQGFGKRRAPRTVDKARVKP